MIFKKNLFQNSNEKVMKHKSIPETLVRVTGHFKQSGVGKY